MNPAAYGSRAERGAILMQALLGLAIMLVMTPIILTQVRRYNEQAHREEAIAQMQLLKKAVTSFISFDKTKVVNNGTQCRRWAGTDMVNALKDYGGANIATSNRFGQEYSFVTYKDSNDSITAVVMASGGGLDMITLNGIGQYLFDRGAVVDFAQTNWLVSNYDMPNLLSIRNCIIDRSIVMFVTDAFFISEYLHVNQGPNGDNTVNTMLTDLYMNGAGKSWNIININDMGGSTLSIIGGTGSGFGPVMLSGTDASFSATSSVSNVLSLLGTGNNPALAIENTISTDIALHVAPNVLSLFDASVDSMSVKTAQFPGGELNSRTITAQNIAVSGNASVMVMDGGAYWNRPSGSPEAVLWRLNADEIKAATLSSTSGENEFSNIKMRSQTGSSDNAIYSGLWSAGSYEPDSSSKINLSGVSEVADICWNGGTTCISREVCRIYNRLEYETCVYIKCAECSVSVDSSTGLRDCFDCSAAASACSMGGC